MFCEKCGKKCNDGVRFCPECGNKLNSSNDYNNTSYYKPPIYPPEPNKPPVTLWRENPIRNLSLLLKIQSILNILVSVIFMFGIFYDGSSKSDTVYNNFYNSLYETFDQNCRKIVDFLGVNIDYLVEVYAGLWFIWLILLIVISIINLYGFRKNLTYSRYILSTPVDIVKHYKEYRLLIKEVILIIISFIFMGHHAVIVILPFIVKLIQQGYVLNNVKVFDEIEENYLENQTSTENSDQSL